MRPQAWVIEERSVGEDTVYDLLHGRQYAATGLNSVQAARSIISNTRRPGERVWQQAEEDGYRTELTKSFPEMADTAHEEEEPEFFDPMRPARSRYLARYGRARRPGRWV